jgi:hypothetical protein
VSYGIGPHDYDCDCWRCQSRRAEYQRFPTDVTSPEPTQKPNFDPGAGADEKGKP